MATIPTNLERLDYGSADGSINIGAHRQIIDGVGATRTLLPGESGALCLFDRAAGNVYTLPAPAVGMQFEFASNVAVTSNASKIITNSATVLLIGSIMGGSLTVADSGDVFQGDNSTHIAVSMNGSTTGGLVGGWLRFTALSATQWLVMGTYVGSGVLATPFATS